MSTDTRFDLSAPYRLSPQVALRAEPFGALAYHYGNRRLTFVRSDPLVALLRDLDNHPSAAVALDAHAVPGASRRALARALGGLADSGVIERREHGREHDRPARDR